MIIEIGDYVVLHRGTTVVRGQNMGWRIDATGAIEEIFIEGFYSGFEIGEDYWLLEDREEEDESEI